MPIEQIRNLYNVADIYVTSTGAEGWNLPVPEAMSCGIPCIIPNNTTGPELLGMNQPTPGDLPFIVCEGGILLNTPHRLNIAFGIVQHHTDCDIFMKD